MASKAMKVIFAALDVPFNSGHYTVIIKRQFVYIDILQFFYHIYLRAHISK